MATESIGQPEGETSAQPVDETASVTGPQETAHVEYNHDHDHEHNHDHEHEHRKQAWYATLNEDWLATSAGLILVVLLVIRFLHAIP